MKQDVYERITTKIVAELEQGVRPWLKPRNAEHAAGRITRPLRHNGVPYHRTNPTREHGAAYRLRWADGSETVSVRDFAPHPSGPSRTVTQPVLRNPRGVGLAVIPSEP